MYTGEYTANIIGRDRGDCIQNIIDRNRGDFAASDEACIEAFI
jgi:hypothetical protein